MALMRKKSTTGFSLIELMIAMLIGLIVLNGVIQVMLSSKRSYLDNQAVSQIQENARFALDALSREIRIAGYIGCMPLNKGELDASAIVGQLPGFLATLGGDLVGLEAINNVTAASAPAQIAADVKLGTDVLIVRHTDVAREYMLPAEFTKVSNWSAIGNGSIKEGEPVALISSGCDIASVFPWGLESVGTFSKQNFKAGSRVSPVIVHAYYVGNSSVVAGMTALKREIIITKNDGSLNTRSEELAMGVDSLQLKIVAAGSAGALSSTDPVGNADGAIAVKLNLALRSHQKVNPVKQDAQGNITDDGFIRKNASVTVRIRNRG